MHKQIVEFEPRVVIIDPLTNFTSVGSNTEVRAMLMRLIDLLKSLSPPSLDRLSEVMGQAA